MVESYVSVKQQSKVNILFLMYLRLSRLRKKKNQFHQFPTYTFEVLKEFLKRERNKAIMGNKIRIFLVTIPGPLLIAVNYKLCSQCRPTKEDIFKSQSKVIT